MQNKAIYEILRSPLRMKLSKLSKEHADDQDQNELEDSETEVLSQSPPVSDQTPRFVSCVSHDIYNGNLKEYKWDQEKIFVHECLQDDLLMLQNVFEGKIISSLVYPLVFNYKSAEREMSLRSVQFYKEVQNDPSLYQNLSPDDKGYFLIGARDLFIAACRGMLSQEEKGILMNIVNMIDPRDSNIVYKTINNLDIAPYPTAVHKMVRFIEEEEKFGDDNNLLNECFVRNELGLLIGFVDPRDLSFHNLENIINLDSLFKAKQDFPITNFEKHGDSEVYTFDLEDSRSLLLSLDKCGLYTQPLNKMSRGGERFIFSSKKLADNLTSSLQKHVSDKTVMNPQFQFVNYVFRYNKFKPGDKKFTSHLDTPYHDPARRHYSKYTLLLYLTSGTADPVLSFDNGNLKIDNIIANNGLVKGIIFDQKYEHEGKSFIDSDKIFLRSELVYEYSKKDLGFNADVSRRFNIACYMTKQSVFNPELEKYASDCFNQVAQARLDLAKAKLTEDVLLYKNYRGVPFITNGYDYWFLKNTGLRKAGIITLLDYFSGTYLKSHMKKEGYAVWYKKYQNVDQGISESLKEITNVKDIFKYLKTYASKSEEGIQDLSKGEVHTEGEEEEIVNDADLVGGLKYDSKAQKRIEKAFTKNNRIRTIDPEPCDFCSASEASDDEEDEDEDDDEENSYDDEYSDSDDRRGSHPTQAEIDEFLQDNNSDIKRDVMDAKKKFTVFIFDKEIKIQTSRIQINDDAIVFNEKIPRVNFASCNFEMDFIINEFTKQKLNLSGFGNIPPIPYKVHDEGYHLKIELFNNGFVRNEEKTLIKYYGHL